MQCECEWGMWKWEKCWCECVAEVQRSAFIYVANFRWTVHRYLLSGLYTIRKLQQTEIKQWNWYAPQIVCRRCFVVVREMFFFCKTRLVLFRRASGLRDKLEGIFHMNWRSRLKRKTLYGQQTVCSTVFVVFRELTIFSVKLSFCPCFVVVCE